MENQTAPKVTKEVYEICKQLGHVVLNPKRVIICPTDVKKIQDLFSIEKKVEKYVAHHIETNNHGGSYYCTDCKTLKRPTVCLCGLCFEVVKQSYQGEHPCIRVARDQVKKRRLVPIPNKLKFSRENIIIKKREKESLLSKKFPMIKKQEK